MPPGGSGAAILARIRTQPARPRRKCMTIASRPHGAVRIAVSRSGARASPSARRRGSEALAQARLGGLPERDEPRAERDGRSRPRRMPPVLLELGEQPVDRARGIPLLRASSATAALRGARRAAPAVAPRARALLPALATCPAGISRPVRASRPASAPPAVAPRHRQLPGDPRSDSAGRAPTTWPMRRARSPSP